MSQIPKPLALVHAGEAELGLLVFVLMDCPRIPTLPLKLSGGRYLGPGGVAHEAISGCLKLRKQWNLGGG